MNKVGGCVLCDCARFDSELRNHMGCKHRGCARFGGELRNHMGRKHGELCEV